MSESYNMRKSIILLQPQVSPSGGYLVVIEKKHKGPNALGPLLASFVRPRNYIFLLWHTPELINIFCITAVPQEVIAPQCPNMYYTKTNTF